MGGPRHFLSVVLLVEILEVLDEPIGAAGRHYQEVSGDHWRKRTNDWLENHMIFITLPETNIAPENGPLEKEIPIGNHHF